MATPIQVGAAPSASPSAAAGRGADLLCRFLRLQSVQTFGRKVRARSQAGPHFPTAVDATIHRCLNLCLRVAARRRQQSLWPMPSLARAC